MWVMRSTWATCIAMIAWRRATARRCAFVWQGQASIIVLFESASERVPTNAPEAFSTPSNSGSRGPRGVCAPSRFADRVYGVADTTAAWGCARPIRPSRRTRSPGAQASPHTLMETLRYSPRVRLYPNRENEKKEKRKDPVHLSKTTSKQIKGDGTHRGSEMLNILTAKVMDRVEIAKIAK